MCKNNSAMGVRLHHEKANIILFVCFNFWFLSYHIHRKHVDLYLVYPEVGITPCSNKSRLPHPIMAWHWSMEREMIQILWENEWCMSWTPTLFHSTRQKFVSNYLSLVVVCCFSRSSLQSFVSFHYKFCASKNINNQTINTTMTFWLQHMAKSTIILWMRH